MMDKGLKENVRHGIEKFPLKIYNPCFSQGEQAGVSDWTDLGRLT